MRNSRVASPDGNGTEVAKAPGMEIIPVLLSILFPPIGVAMRIGFRPHFWINLLLTLFGYVPGLVHAVWVLAQTSGIRMDVRRIDHAYNHVYY